LNPELDLGDENNTGRVLGLPDEDAPAAEEQDDDIPEVDLIDEDEAMALAKRPLDEILGYNRDKEKTDAEDSVVADEPEQENKQCLMKYKAKKSRKFWLVRVLVR